MLAVEEYPQVQAEPTVLFRPAGQYLYAIFMAHLTMFQFLQQAG
jgi:hypothetical protein